MKDNGAGAIEAAQEDLTVAGGDLEAAAREYGADSRQAGVARERRASAQRRLEELDGTLAARAMDPIATRLWGEMWASGFARFMGINPRTAQRIYGAAKSGSGHLAAIKQAPEFFDRLAAVAAEAANHWPPR